MASPQIDKGNFTKISNEILERLAQCRLSGKEFQAAIYVLRLTYGYQRKEAEISSSDLGEQMDADASDVRKVLGALCGRNILVKISSHKGVRPPVYLFNKDWDTWAHGRRASLPGLISSRGKFTPTRELVGEKNHPDKQGEFTPTNAQNSPRLTRKIHPDYVSKDAEQTDGPETLRKKKEERRNIPPTPYEKSGVPGETSGGGECSVFIPEKKRSASEIIQADIQRIHGLDPKPKEVARTLQVFRTRVPPDWDPLTWKRHTQATFWEILSLVVAENASAKFAAPTSVACSRTEAKLQIDARTPRKEAI